MAINKAVRAVAAGALTIIAGTSLAACTADSSLSVSAPVVIDREASAYKPSFLCVVNYGDDIMFVGEFGMNRTGETDADPSGPLEEGGQWCTSGFDAFSDATGMSADVIAEVKFSDAPGDFVRFAFRNGYMWGDPYVMFGQEILDNTFPTADDPFYREFDLPDSGRNIYFEAPYEGPDFQEWTIEVN